MEIEPSYSASIIKSYMLKNLDLGYEEYFSRIASSDHVLPKALLHKLMTNIGGETNEPINVSSIVLNYFDEEQNIYIYIYTCIYCKDEMEMSQTYSASLWIN